jgi:GTP-binding protein HflX
LKALIETRKTRPERVFLVGVELKSRDRADTSDSLAELGELATTAGGEVIGDGWQKVVSLNPATFIGAGKAANSRISAGGRTWTR